MVQTLAGSGEHQKYGFAQHLTGINHADIRVAAVPFKCSGATARTRQRARIWSLLLFGASHSISRELPTRDVQLLLLMETVQVRIAQIQLLKDPY